MNLHDDPYLRQPSFARTWRSARARAEANGRVTGRITLDNPTPDELDAVGGLLGRVVRPTADGKLRVGLQQLDRALRESRLQAGLAEVLEALGDPLRDLPAEREAARRGVADAWEAVCSHPSLAKHPGLDGWLTRVRSSGLHIRSARGREPFALLNACLGVLVALPAEPAEGLAAFAARTCPGSDTHALDRGRPLDGLSLSALAYLNDTPAPRAAGARRALWAAWGVICDELSVTALTCGLRPIGHSYLDRSLREAAGAGEPRRVTLRELRGLRTMAAGPEVFVCENPEVVAAAAAALGRRCPPLICTEGQPSVACMRLLTSLAAGGARLRVRCDLDPAGLTIAAGLATKLPCRPWRMDAHAYALTSDGLPWEGPPPADPDLSAAVARAGRVQLEEQPEILAALLNDLRDAARNGTGSR